MPAPRGAANPRRRRADGGGRGTARGNRHECRIHRRADPARREAAWRHAPQGRGARWASQRCRHRQHDRPRLRTVARDRLQAGHGMRSLAIAPLDRLPLAIGAMALLFLGAFLIYPLWGVLSASILTPDGTAFTLDNYGKLLSRAFYRASVINTLSIGLMA